MKSNEKNFIKRLQRQKEDALEFIVDTYLPLIKGITYKVLSPLENDGCHRRMYKRYFSFNLEQFKEIPWRFSRF